MAPEMVQDASDVIFPVPSYSDGWRTCRPFPFFTSGNHRRLFPQCSSCLNQMIFFESRINVRLSEIGNKAFFRNFAGDNIFG